MVGLYLAISSFTFIILPYFLPKLIIGLFNVLALNLGITSVLTVYFFWGNHWFRLVVLCMLFSAFTTVFVLPWLCAISILIYTYLFGFNI